MQKSDFLWNNKVKIKHFSKTKRISLVCFPFQYQRELLAEQEKQISTPMLSAFSKTLGPATKRFPFWLLGELLNGV